MHAREGALLSARPHRRPRAYLGSGLHSSGSASPRPAACSAPSRSPCSRTISDWHSGSPKRTLCSSSLACGGRSRGRRRQAGGQAGPRGQQSPGHCCRLPWVPRGRGARSLAAAAKRGSAASPPPGAGRAGCAHPALLDHEPREEDPPERRPLGAHPARSGVHNVPHHRLLQRRREHGRGGVAAHAAGVGAGVAVTHGLVVLRAGQGDAGLAVDEREERRLLPVQELLHHDLGARRAKNALH